MSLVSLLKGSAGAALPKLKLLLGAVTPSAAASSSQSLSVTSVDVNHYARYGKTRAEEDARRYLQQKEELEEQKKELRSALVSLRKEKREVKEEMKSRTGETRRNV